MTNPDKNNMLDPQRLVVFVMLVYIESQSPSLFDVLSLFRWESLLSSRGNESESIRGILLTLNGIMLV